MVRTMLTAGAMTMALATPAMAQSGLLSPTPGDVTNAVPADVTGALPVIGTTLKGLLDGATGGATGGSALPVPLPVPVPPALERLLPPLPVPVPIPGSQPQSPTTGAGGGAAPATPAGDTRAPKVRIKLISRLRRAAKKGRLLLRVRLDEPGAVALQARSRPGPKRLRAVGRYSRRTFDLPTRLLTFKKARSIKVALPLTRVQRRTLLRARDVRVRVAVMALDNARNMRTKTQKFRIGDF